MRILSIIALCFIIALPAVASESKQDREESKDKPAAAQSSAPKSESAPAHTVSAFPSTQRSAEAPRPTVGSVRPGFGPSEAPRASSYTPNTPRAEVPNRAPVSVETRPGFGRPDPQPVSRPQAPVVAPAQPHVETGYSSRQGFGDRNQPQPSNPTGPSGYRPPTPNTPRENPNMVYGNPRPDYRPAERPANMPDPVRPVSSTQPVTIAPQPNNHQGTGYTPQPTVSRPSVPASGYNPSNSGRSNWVHEPGRVVSQTPSNVTIRRPDGGSTTIIKPAFPGTAPRVIQNPAPKTPAKSHSGGYTPGRNGYSTGYSPDRTTYTIGYHHPTKFYVPKTYTPPTFRRGSYYYQPKYHSRPCHYAYWAFDYAPGFSWRSLYFHYGMFPYVRVTRLTEVSYTTINYISEPIYVAGGAYRNDSRYDNLNEALGDIRSAWISGRFDLIQRHVRPNRSIAVLQDGQYDYGISSEDYLDMTRDAIGDLETVSFVWDTVRERRDGTITAFGEHSYRSSDRTHTVYVSYTLQRVGREYYITEVGSSLSNMDSI